MDNTIVLSLEGISNKADLHKLLKESLSLSDYYGNNLDALQDELSTISRPVSVSLMDVDRADPSMISYISNMIEVFEDSAAENTLIDFSIIEEPDVTPRKEIAVCGVWEDAENLNYFLRSLQSEELLEKFYISSYTFVNYESLIHENADIGINLVNLVKLNKPAALIIFAEMIKNPAIINALISYGKEVSIPVFVMEHEYDSCINLRLEYTKSFRKIVEHIVKDHGCKRIDMMAGGKGNSFSENRIQVYRDVLTENGIPFDESNIHYGEFWGHPARLCMEKLLKEGYELPEAIICANDSMAIGVCDLLLEYGYKVPEDCIITGFDGIWQARYHNPVISTATPDYDTLSNLILETITNWKPEKNFITENHDIDFRLMPAASCGCQQNDTNWTEGITEMAESNKDYYYHQLEMGKFLTRSIAMDSPEMACTIIEPHLWQWREQYYIIGINEHDHIHVPFLGKERENNYSNNYYNLNRALPDMREVTSVESKYNVFLYADISSNRESFGYVCTAYDHLSLRKQQRFEEFRNYVSGVTHSVIRNQKLIKANADIEKLSGMDYLTGLQNRRGFFKNITKELKSQRNAGKYFTLFSIDMDSLKKINDTYGHIEGDIAIKVLADAITGCSQGYKKSLGARYGGDEFALFVIEDSPIAVKAEALRERIETIAAKDSRIAGKDYQIRASIGGASCIIDDKFNIEDIINSADKTMYTDKENRKKAGN